jgi:conjugative transfer region lipoprotein (TIGR03751 family)
MASNKLFQITRVLACALAAASFAGCSVTGPRESPLKEVTKDSPTLLDIYRGKSLAGQAVAQGAEQGSRQASAKETARDRLERDSKARPIAQADGNTGRYWSALEPMQQRFARVANPDLVMVVYPHLARGKYPVPGYVTVFPMYESTEYAMPGESTEDLQRGRAAFSGRAGGGEAR